MNEEFVENIVMSEEFVENSVMNAKIVPTVVMELSIFKIARWNNLQPIKQKFWKNFLEEIMDDNEPWLLIGSPNRDPFFVTQHLERHCASSDPHMKK